MTSIARATPRRALLRAALGLVGTLPVGACSRMPGLFAQRPHPYTLSPRGDRLVRWLQDSGWETMLAPNALALMGVTNEGRWIPARQLAEDGPDGRYVVSLVNIRKIHDLVFHRRAGDVLILHLSDTAFRRLASVRWTRNGEPTLITDTAFAENDFQQQIAFWFRVMPSR